MPCKHAEETYNLALTKDQLYSLSRMGEGYVTEIGKGEPIRQMAKELLDSIPKTIQIGAFSVPEPMRGKPAIGQKYYAVAPFYEDGVFDTDWEDLDSDNWALNRGICHLTRDNCIAHAKALFSFSEIKE